MANLETQGAKFGDSNNTLWLKIATALQNAELYDPDAAAYFAANDVTDAAKKTRINDFFLGIKNDIGIWNDFVGWLLTDGYALGSGATRNSFGGLGSYPATLVNGPATQDDDGLLLVAASSQSLTTALAPTSAAMTMGAVAQTTTTGGQYFIAQDDAAAQRRFGLFQNGGDVYADYFIPGEQFINVDTVDTAMHFHQMYVSAGASGYLQDGVASGVMTTGSLVSATSTVRIGARSDGASYFDGPIAFAFIVTTAYASDALRTLYKSTVGNLLSLP